MKNSETGEIIKPFKIPERVHKWNEYKIAEVWSGFYI
jgi:hypothetical protein